MSTWIASTDNDAQTVVANPSDITMTPPNQERPFQSCKKLNWYGKKLNWYGKIFKSATRNVSSQTAPFRVIPSGFSYSYNKTSSYIQLVCICIHCQVHYTSKIILWQIWQFAFHLGVCTMFYVHNVHPACHIWCVDITFKILSWVYMSSHMQLSTTKLSNILVSTVSFTADGYSMGMYIHARSLEPFESVST